MTVHSGLPFTLGSFLVSPSARATEAGDFAPSVSLRRGRGSGTCDKVFRFTRRFSCHRSAIAYAIAQGQALAFAATPDPT